VARIPKGDVAKVLDAHPAVQAGKTVRPIPQIVPLFDPGKETGVIATPITSTPRDPVPSAVIWWVSGEPRSHEG